MAINVAFTIDQKYAPYMATTLASLLYHNSNEVFHVYILYNKLTAAAKRNIKNVSKGTQHQFFFLGIDDHILKDAPITHHISLATYYRLTMPDILPPAITKILFLDADIMIRHSIRELWEIDVENYALAATIAAGMDNYPKEIELPPQSLYFNAGMMLINIVYWRKANVLSNSIQLIRSESHRIKWWDQDVLNIIFENKWLPVSLVWNAQPYLFDDINKATAEIKLKYEGFNYKTAVVDPKIMHYAGGGKPWMPNCNLPFTNEYLSFYNKTSWKPPIFTRCYLAFKKIIRKIIHD